MAGAGRERKERGEVAIHERLTGTMELDDSHVSVAGQLLQIIIVALTHQLRLPRAGGIGLALNSSQVRLRQIHSSRCVGV